MNLYPQTLWCVFPKNKDIIFCNHSVRIKVRKLTKMLCYFLICSPYSDLTDYPNSGLCNKEKPSSLVAFM